MRSVRGLTFFFALPSVTGDSGPEGSTGLIGVIGGIKSPGPVTRHNVRYPERDAKQGEDVPSCGLRADGSMGGRPTNLSWDAPFILSPGVFGGG